MKVRVRLTGEGGDIVHAAPVVTYTSDGDGDLWVRCLHDDGSDLAGAALYARDQWVLAQVDELPASGTARREAVKLQRKAEGGLA